MDSCFAKTTDLSELDDSSSILVNGSVASLVICAQMCLQNLLCESFFYNRFSQNNCILINGTSEQKTGISNVAVWGYFAIVAPQTTYIRVVTGNVRYAGTDARVTLTIYGPQNRTQEFKLEDASVDLLKFEQGKTDTFSFRHVHIGKVKRIKICHDNYGYAAGWYCDSLTLCIPGYADVTITVGAWLGIEEGLCVSKDAV